MRDDINIDLIETLMAGQGIGWTSLIEKRIITLQEFNEIFTDLDFFHHMHILHNIAEYFNISLTDLYKK